MIAKLIFAAATVALGACSGGPDKPEFCHGLDCPIFTTRDKTDSYELRRYEPARWVSTIVEHHDFAKAQREGFWRLFKYIGGDNHSGDHISMTAPVRTLVHPGEGPSCKSNFTISFYLPLAYQDSPPKPSSGEVFIEDNEEFEAYVASYGGWNSEDHFTQVAVKLYDELAKKHKVRDDIYFTASYDSPVRLINRHNEVWLLKESKKSDLIQADR